MKELKKLAKEINKETEQRIIVEVESFDNENIELVFTEGYDEFTTTLPKEQAKQYLKGVLSGLELALTPEARREKYED